MRTDLTLRLRLRRAALICVAMLGLGAAATPQEAWARKPAVYVGFLQKAAIGGYDPVSYFSGTPVLGVEGNQVAYLSAKYFFATPANAAKFKANPATYAPQYGGYCAWAVAQGKTAPGDPRFWKIVGGKLYLNYNAEVQRKWEKDIPGFIAKAEANWPRVLE